MTAVISRCITNRNVKSCLTGTLAEHTLLKAMTKHIIYKSGLESEYVLIQTVDILDRLLEKLIRELENNFCKQSNKGLSEREKEKTIISFTLQVMLPLFDYNSHNSIKAFLDLWGRYGQYQMDIISYIYLYLYYRSLYGNGISKGYWEMICQNSNWKNCLGHRNYWNVDKVLALELWMDWEQYNGNGTVKGLMEFHVFMNKLVCIQACPNENINIIITEYLQRGEWGVLIKKRKYTKPKRSIYRRIDMMTCCYKETIIALAHDKSSGEEQIIQKISEIVHRDYVHSCNVLFGKRRYINDEGRIRISTDSEYAEEQKRIKNRLEIKNSGDRNPVLKLQGIELDLMDNMKEYSDNRNKKMLAFSQSLLRIIHIMRQQYKKGNHKNIFYIFYPQVVLFVQLFGEGKKQLETEKEQHLSNLKSIDRLPYEKRQIKSEAEVSLYNEKKYQIIGEIEQAFRDFIDITEILLHQIGHSSESVFEDRSPDLFLDDIPIKLCFLYIAYMHEVTYLLNDDFQNEYQYCLSPLAYSVPETECFEFGLLPKSRLIKVMISRHMMFTPRSLFIILSHEVSHYVNDRIRSRVFRSSCMEKILGIVFTEIFYNIDISENVPEDVKKYYRWSKKIRKNLSTKR